MKSSQSRLERLRRKRCDHFLWLKGGESCYVSARKRQRCKITFFLSLSTAEVQLVVEFQNRVEDKPPVGKHLCGAATNAFKDESLSLLTWLTVDSNTTPVALESKYTPLWKWKLPCQFFKNMFFKLFNSARLLGDGYNQKLTLSYSSPQPGY